MNIENKTFGYKVDCLLIFIDTSLWNISSSEMWLYFISGLFCQ